MVANESRAWSSALKAFWKKSFQTSTGYVLWLSSEHFISVTKLLDVRCVALEKKQTRSKAKTQRAYGDLSQDGNVAKAKSLSGIHSYSKDKLTKEQACALMVKLHRALEELPVDRLCSSCDLRKTIKRKPLSPQLGRVKEHYLCKLSPGQNCNSPTY